MGRSPCCSKEGLNRGAWTAIEDKILMAYIKAHGEGNWRNLPKKAGLKRCGKSCRLRWLNYLRPDIKRGNISHDEEELIIRLHKLLGNRWSLIAGRLPGRTDNEIKNYWNTTLGKKANAQSSKVNPSLSLSKNLSTEPSASPKPTQLVRTQATRCTKSVFPLQYHPPILDQPNHQELGFLNNIDTDGHEFFQFSDYDNPSVEGNYMAMVAATVADHQQPLPLEEEQPIFNDLNARVHSIEDNSNFNLDSLAFLLDSEDWPEVNYTVGDH